jgi:hypothetical protein
MSEARQVSVEFIAENFSGLASTSILVRIGIILRRSEKESRNESRIPESTETIHVMVVEFTKPSPDPTEGPLLVA